MLPITEGISWQYDTSQYNKFDGIENGSETNGDVWQSKYPNDEGNDGLGHDAKNGQDANDIDWIVLDIVAGADTMFNPFARSVVNP